MRDSRLRLRASAGAGDHHLRSDHAAVHCTIRLIEPSAMNTKVTREANALGNFVSSTTGSIMANLDPASRRAQGRGRRGSAAKRLPS